MYVVSKVKEQLGDPTTQEQIHDKSIAACGALPEGVMREACTEFVDDYGELLHSLIPACCGGVPPVSDVCVQLWQLVLPSLRSSTYQRTQVAFAQLFGVWLFTKVYVNLALPSSLHMSSHRHRCVKSFAELAILRYVNTKIDITVFGFLQK